ncbi:hypothetical protein HYC85_030172 [Camellia sinensis]|uniref:RING-type domain-containing protein n=1 Tax=Camellia sinensis TaxID=4442 RepID=A0A7J7G1F0_CAMSI|nr:hypothetical protein HYC85_030172 [Camellia sinensis]
MISESSSSGLNLEGLEDVEEFAGTSEGDSSMSLERFCHVSDLMQMGNQAFRENRFEEAINCYSRANNIKPSDPVILSNRCAAYLRICQFLKHRSPLASEHNPLSGLDPTTHAELALKDAEKVMNFRSDSIKSHILKANALILLERYELARDVILSGLQVDPMSIPLKVLERTTASTIGRRGQKKAERTDDFDCTLCLKLLYEPVTTPCGHSFCRSCLFQAMDRGNRCPLCRTVLFISPRTCAISVTLNNIIEKNFPEEYAERKLEYDSLTNSGADLMPLFVMDVVLPCQKFHLNIFEPRYRLMVRRIMEGNHRMGMVITDPTTGSVADVACEVEITECEPLPDGRFFLEGSMSCSLKAAGDSASYVLGIKMGIEWLKLNGYMIYIHQKEQERKQISQLQELTNNASGLALSWMRRARQAAEQRRDRIRLLELDKAESMMPTTRDPERYSFWLATLTNRRPSERLQLLRMRDTNEVFIGSL